MAEYETSQLEVEFKFVIPDDLVEKLNDLGAQQVSHKLFTDRYVDTKNYQLCLRGK